VFERRCVRGLSLRDAETVELTLLGKQRKAVAPALGLSQAQASVACGAALQHLGCSPRAFRTPIVIVMAVHAARGYALPPAQCVSVPGTRRFVVSHEIPGRRWRTLLTSSEWEVAELLLEGKSSHEIAACRHTHVRTTANQFAAISHKIGTSGRVALRAQAVVTDSVPPERPSAAPPPRPSTTTTFLPSKRAHRSEPFGYANAAR
jgi:DNA-binding CsgD family transcriptional regulator